MAIFIFTTFIACKKNDNTSPAPSDFVGTWTISQVFGNDYWGGAAYWKNADGKTKIKFTTDGKYFKEYSTDSTYTFIGTFQKLSDSTIQITQTNPVNPSYPSYILNYSFSIGGYMTWGNFGTEAIIKEKYKLN